MQYILNEEEKKQFEDFKKFQKDAKPFALIEMKHAGDGFRTLMLSVFNESDIINIIKEELYAEKNENKRLRDHIDSLKKKRFW